jgi:hypothetical protein
VRRPTSLRCKNSNFRNYLNQTHLCCVIVNVWQYDDVGRYNPITRFRSEVTMPAVADALSTVAPDRDPRGCDLPTCPVCADSMVAAEASAYLADNLVSYLWTCDTCGYGFVTKHSLKRPVCN